MNNIRKILSNYEGEYNPEGWSQLEKRLPKQTVMQRFGKKIIAGAVGAIVVAGIVAAVVLIPKNEAKTIEEPSDGQKNTIETVQNSNVSEIAEVQDQTTVMSENENVTPTSLQQADNVVTSVEQPQQISSKEEANNNIVEEQPQQKSSQDNQQPTTTANTRKPEPAFSYSCDSYCAPAMVKFTAVNTDANTEIVWNFGNGKQARGTSVAYEYPKKGSFTPTASVYYGGKLEKTVALKQIVVNNGPEFDFTWKNDENTYKFYTDRTMNISYSWEIDGKSYTSKVVEREFTRNGNYPIKLVLTDNNGCKTEKTKTLNVTIAHLFYVPNAFTPDEGGVNSTFGPIGEEMDFKSFSFGITNAKGETVFTSTDPDLQWNGKMNNSGADVDAGLYYWTIKTTDKYGNSQTKKGTVTVIR